SQKQSGGVVMKRVEVKRVLWMTCLVCAVWAVEALAQQPPAVRGSGTPGRISKFTTNTTIGDSAIFESAGNIGVGTTTPSVKLDVTGPVKATSFTGNGSG